MSHCVYNYGRDDLSAQENKFQQQAYKSSRLVNTSQTAKFIIHKIRQSRRARFYPDARQPRSRGPWRTIISSSNGRPGSISASKANLKIYTYVRPRRVDLCINAHPRARPMAYIIFNLGLIAPLSFSTQRSWTFKVDARQKPRHRRRGRARPS